MENFQVYLGAVDLIERDGWVQKHWGYNSRRCIARAVHDSLCAIRGEDPGPIHKAVELPSDIAAELLEVLRQNRRFLLAERWYSLRGRELTPTISLVAWNDNQLRTKSQVLSVLRCAAIRAAAKETDSAGRWSLEQEADALREELSSVLA